MEKIDKKQIRQARALAESGNWRELLTQCRQKENPAPEILVFRLTAACKLKADSEVNEALAVIDGFEADEPFYAVPHHVTRVVRVLEASHRFEQAGAALLQGGTKAEWASVHCFLASRLARIIPGASNIKEELKKHLATRISLADESEIPSSPSPFEFPPFDLKTGSRFANPTTQTFLVTASNEGLAPTVSRYYQFRDKFLPRLEPGKPEKFPQFENVRVNRIGQIWTEDGKVIRACQRPIPEADLNADAVTEVDEGVALLLGVKGVYHWMAEMLSSVSWLASPAAAEIKAVIPGDAPKFKIDSLRLGGIQSEQIVRLQTPVCSFKRLHYPGAWQRSIFYSVSFFENMIARAQAEATLPVEPRRVYVTRRDTNRRVLDNEATLEKELTQRGFFIAEMSKLSLADQITLFANATVVVAPHGAGLTHLIFSKPETKIFEIIPAFNGMLDGTIHLRFNYARMSMMKGLHYRAFLQEYDPAKSNWTADLPAVLAQLD